jgi:hypothetical protein
VNTYAILEKFGHIRLIGYVTEEEHFGAKLGRIDVLSYLGGEWLRTTQYFGAESIYALIPTDEATAKKLVQPYEPKPLVYRDHMTADRMLKWLRDLIPQVLTIEDIDGQGDQEIEEVHLSEAAFEAATNAFGIDPEVFEDDLDRLPTALWFYDIQQPNGIKRRYLKSFQFDGRVPHRLSDEGEIIEILTGE